MRATMRILDAGAAIPSRRDKKAARNVACVLSDSPAAESDRCVCETGHDFTQSRHEKIRMHDNGNTHRKVAMQRPQPDANR
jgi:hypothetical protein